jgi:SAM-dependent methyltransferase
MAQADGGVYSLLKSPALYNAVQRLLVNGDTRQRLVDDHIRPEDGSRVLDIGCGPGAMLPYLGRVDYIGIDPEPVYIDLAQARHGRQGTFTCAGVDDIGGWYEGGFDRVIAIGVLHHLDDASAAMLFDAAARALKPGGRLVTSDPVWRSGQNLVARILIGLDRGKSVRSEDGYRALAEASFRCVEAILRPDFMRIRYENCVLVCEKQAAGAG